MAERCVKCGGQNIRYHRESSGRLSSDERHGYRTYARCENCGHMWEDVEGDERSSVVLKVAVAIAAVTALIIAVAWWGIMHG